MSDPALSARRLLDERRYRATPVTGNPPDLRPGAGIENELSAQLGAGFVFQMTLAPAPCFSALLRAMSDISDYAAMVISHNLIIGGKQGSPSSTALCAATPSNRHEILRCTNKLRSRSPIRIPFATPD